MKKMIIAILAVIILGTTTCFAGTKIDWDNNVITAKGIGVIPTYATTSGQAQALARRAAIVSYKATFFAQLTTSSDFFR